MSLSLSLSACGSTRDNAEASPAGNSPATEDTGGSDGDTSLTPLFSGDVPGSNSDDDDPPDSPIIPSTCAQTLSGQSTVGCLFFGLDLDSHDSVEEEQFAIVVSNVQKNVVSNVTLEQKKGAGWTALQGPIEVAALSLHSFELPSRSQDDSGIYEGGAYRVTSDVPIVAYQFNPVDGQSSFLSDASMLYPVPSWDTINQVVGWKVISESGIQGAYLTIVAAYDGTEVTVTPSQITLAGTGVPAGTPGEPFLISLNEGDVAEVMTTMLGKSLSGTRVVSNEEHPIALFTGNECTNIPDNIQSCDHLEEQLSGVRRWGKHFIAARVPPRSSSIDTSLWQIYAAENDTTISFNADATVTGVPAEPIVLSQGETAELYVGGTVETPGDFEINSDKPIAVLNYMTGSQNPGAAGTGDPAMVQTSPSEQFLPRYVVLVPQTWKNDFAVISRPKGASISLDGTPIDDALFVAVADSDFEAARVPIKDGTHLLDGGDSPFSVVIMGYDEFDSYAYLGGVGTGVINPNPPIR